MAEKRVSFDFSMAFSNGGGLQGQSFHLDIDGEDISDEALAAYIIRELRLLMVGKVSILNKRIVEERHKHLVPAETPTREAVDANLIDLSHVIDMAASAGTSINSPYRRYSGKVDLSTLPLHRLADVPGVVVRVTSMADRAIDWTHFAGIDTRGRAVLVNTGWDRHWRTDKYYEGHPFLTKAAAEHLRDQGAALVGIDSSSIDDPADPAHPVQSILLGAGIPIVEHLANLTALPVTGFRFSSVPPKVPAMGTFPVRAHAVLTSADAPTNGSAR